MEVLESMYQRTFNTERNIGNGVNNDCFRKIKKEFRRAAIILYKTNLKLSCKTPLDMM
ncbi:26934_t:CDS:1, partial [Dentiscutata erythropus]